MGNSSSIYNKLSQELQNELNELYKSYKCRYDYLKTLEPTTETIAEQHNIQNEFKTLEKGKVHENLRLKDIIPNDVRKRLDSECSDDMKLTPVNINTLIQKRNDIAKKIKDFMFSETSNKEGFTQMRHMKTEGGSKKSRSKKHRSKKHRSKKHRSKKHRSKKNKSRR